MAKSEVLDLKDSRKVPKRTKKTRSRRIPLLVKVALFCCVAVFLYLCVTFFQVYNAARTDEVNESTRADAIVVLGAAQYNGRPSAVLVARLEHALELYEEGTAPVIIVTGGNQPGDTTTEASASANWLLERGVDDAKILREVQGHSTYDSIRDLSAFAHDEKIKKVVIVTDGFHQKRAMMIAEDFGLDPIGSPVKDSPITGSDERKYFFTETGRVSLGRIIGFRRVSKDSSLAGLVK